MTQAVKPDLPVKLFRNQSAWDNWLDRHGTSSTGLWLRIAKKAASLKSVSYAEALESALCHGWIDGQRRAHDENSFLQRFTPRGPRSIWSKINRTKVLALIDSGRMRPAGLRAIERAKQNGRWDAAYDSHSTADVPDDFLAALDRNPAAKVFFASLNNQNRYAVIFRLQTAIREDTRARRIEKFIEMFARNKKLHP
ncbi:MAG: YdeI/OmpD-associated family protein [Gemmatimonadaceae bacterium]